jgi:hypothetical protein
MGVSPNLGMTHKERYLTAIQHKQPDTVPIDCWLDLVHVERILNKRTRDASLFVDKNPAQVKEDMNDLILSNICSARAS